jgi:hypothetical protein
VPLRSIDVRLPAQVGGVSGDGISAFFRQVTQEAEQDQQDDYAFHGDASGRAWLTFKYIRVRRHLAYF